MILLLHSEKVESQIQPFLFYYGQLDWNKGLDRIIN